MKRFLQIVVRAVMIASIVIFIGSCIYQYTDYKQHPEIYMLNSAPWYICTDLTIDPVRIAELYGFRFNIERCFREFKQQLGGFCYHF